MKNFCFQSLVRLFRPDILFQYRLREKNTRFLGVNPSPGRTQDVQEIKFQKDGCQFDQYGHSSIQKLEDKRKTLILKGESTGNRQTLHFQTP